MLERERFLMPDEVPVFFEALDSFDDRVRDFFLLCIYTGARRSNIMAMRRDEIDLDWQRWTIPHKKSKNKAPIVLPLVHQAVEIIERRIKENGDSPWIFPSSLSKSGHYMEPKEAWTRLRDLAAKTKPSIKTMRIHDLRRTLGSWQANANVSLQIIGKSMGHLSSSSTLIYARLAVDPVREAIQKATSLIDVTAKPPVKKKSKKSPKS